jgi:hypothetical protein
MAKVWAADEEVELATLITVEGPLLDGGAEEEDFEAVELVELVELIKVLVVDLEILDVLVVVAVFVEELVEVTVVEMTIDRAVDEDPLYPRE